MDHQRFCGKDTCLWTTKRNCGKDTVLWTTNGFVEKIKNNLWTTKTICGKDILLWTINSFVEKIHRQQKTPNLFLKHQSSIFEEYINEEDTLITRITFR